MARPIRVLYAVYGSHVGGIKMWLLQLLRTINRERFKTDVLLTKGANDPYAPRMRELGCQILPLLPAPYSTFPRRFASLVREHGPYDVLHSNLGVHDGVMMWLARRVGIPVRISHSRNAICHWEPPNNPYPLWRRLAGKAYRCVLRHSILQHATHLLAVSRLAAVSLYGPSVLHDRLYKWLPSSLDIGEFSRPVQRKAIRQAFGIGEEALVVGHVGRFAPQKNHEFVVQIAAEVIRRESRVHFVLVGDGPLRPAIWEEVNRRGLSGNIHFTGVRDDVPELMKGLMDVLLLPSRWEGLCRVVLEAQLAGLPCLISNVLPKEVDVAKPLITRLSLSTPPGHWAETLLTLLHTPRPLTSQDVCNMMAGTLFNIEVAVKELECIYATARQGEKPLN
ncbi:MAG: glycosyltransferase [Candidatus Zipacnadales bacterium]